jgi:HEAT repeat protein
MDELLEQFLRETDPTELIECTMRLSGRENPDDVPFLIDALQDKVESRRWGAAYALGFARRDRRAVIPLINVLLDRNETARVRAEAAECLGYLGYQRAIKALIRCSRDLSPEVRFWCVFGLGQITSFRRKKLTRAGVRALESRLLDTALPDGKGWWPIRFEALAMLEGKSATGSRMFRAEMARVLDDPIAHADLWPWAEFYAEDIGEAIRKITSAGFDPSTLGRG